MSSSQPYNPYSHVDTIKFLHLAGVIRLKSHGETDGSEETDTGKGGGHSSRVGGRRAGTAVSLGGRTAAATALCLGGGDDDAGAVGWDGGGGCVGRNGDAGGWGAGDNVGGRAVVGAMAVGELDGIRI